MSISKTFAVKSAVWLLHNFTIYMEVWSQAQT